MGQEGGDPCAEAFSLRGPGDIAGALLVVGFRVRRPLAVGFGQAGQGGRIRLPAPGGIGLGEEPRPLAGRGALGDVEPQIARLEQAAEPAGRESPDDPRAEGQEGPRGAGEGDRHAGTQGERPAVALGFFPDEHEVVRGGAGDLHLVEGEALGLDAAEDLLDLGLLSARPEHGERAVLFRGRCLRRGEEKRQTLGVRGRGRRHSGLGRCQEGEPTGRRHAPKRKGRGRQPIPRQGIQELPHHGRPDDARQLDPHIAGEERREIEVPEGLVVDRGGIGQAMGSQVGLVGRQEGHQLGLLCGTGKRSPLEVRRPKAGQAEFPNRRPQGIRHLRVLGQRAEVAGDAVGQLEQQPHDERRAQDVRGGVDLPFDQEGGGHLQGKIQRRQKAQVRPVRALQRQPLAQGMADRVRWDEDPLGHRSVTPAQLRELSQERISRHDQSLNRMVGCPGASPHTMTSAADRAMSGSASLRAITKARGAPPARPWARGAWADSTPHVLGGAMEKRECVVLHLMGKRGAVSPIGLSPDFPYTTARKQFPMQAAALHWRIGRTRARASEWSSTHDCSALTLLMV